MLSEVIAAIKEKTGGTAGSVPNWESGVDAFRLGTQKTMGNLESRFACFRRFVVAMSPKNPALSQRARAWTGHPLLFVVKRTGQVAVARLAFLTVVPGWREC